ncbi:MAG: signal peptidase I [Clostridiales bacterium]|nr:signal peptidase I [Clostridiales bacterium]
MENNNIAETNNGVKVSTTAKVLNIIAIVLSVILLPILVFNCILLVKGIVNEDEVPSFGGYTPLIVESPSMEDTIMTGDLIFIKKTDISELEVGDVITFYNPLGDGKSLVTHRIIEITENQGARYFLTQGDNNNIDDKDPIHEDDVLGVWTEKRVPLLGSIMLFMQKPLGMIICIFIPVACFVGCELAIKYRKDKATKKDVDALRAELEALKKEKENNDNQ